MTVYAERHFRRLARSIQICNLFLPNRGQFSSRIRAAPFVTALLSLRVFRLKVVAEGYLYEQPCREYVLRDKPRTVDRGLRL